MTAYYNEIDEEKAETIRELIKAGIVAPGDVDERSITDVRADDLRGYTQCHFFAGFGVWSYALRLAGWPDDREVWTGSCPCPSFSHAGKGGGFNDARHLWPAWYPLIRERRPGVVLGEQVAAAVGHGWLDLVCGDMEAEEYAIAAAVLGAHSAGAPHIRQRLYFCADAERVRLGGGRLEHGESGTRGEILLGDDSIGEGLEGHGEHVGNRGKPGWLDSEQTRLASEAGATRGFWADCDWWYGRDGKWRPIKPGLFPLAHGAAARVLKLRGAGDAICPQAAAYFIEAYQDARNH